MPEIDVPYLAHQENMANPDSHYRKSPPSYQGYYDGYSHAHHAPAAAYPRARPWYRRPVFVVTVAIITLILCIAISATLPYVLKSRHEDNAAAPDATSTKVTVQTKTSQTSETSVGPLTITKDASSFTSIFTVTLSAPGESSTQGVRTLTQTVTQSEEIDIDKLISSKLADLSYISTKVITKSKSKDADPSTAISSFTVTKLVPTTVSGKEHSEAVAPTDSTSTKPSTDSNTENVASSTLSSSKTDKTNSFQLVSETTQSSVEPSRSIQEPSSKTSTTANPSDTSIRPSISQRSNIAAVDVSIGPEDLRRRLVIWQDTQEDLVARDSASGNTEIYKIKGNIGSKSGKGLAAAKVGTSLAATQDDQGSIHLFYMSDGNQVNHVIQQSVGEWRNEGKIAQASDRFSLSATWHQSGDDKGVIVVAYEDLDSNICLLMSSEPDAVEWNTYTPEEIQSNETVKGELKGLTLASGIDFANAQDPKPAAGEYCGLHVMLESEDSVQVAECEIDGGKVTSCAHSDAFISDTNQPISVSSHPTRLAWSLIRPEDGAPPTLYGFLALAIQDKALVDNRFLTRAPEPTSKGGVSQLIGKVEAHDVMDNEDIHAISITDERALFIRSDTKLYEFEMDDGDWKVVREVDTALSDE